MWVDVKTSLLVCWSKGSVFIVWCQEENNSIDTAILEHRGQKHTIFGKPLEQLAEAVPPEKKEKKKSSVPLYREC